MKPADADTELSLVIKDDATQLQHAVPNRARLVKTLAVGIILWLLPFAALLAWRGPVSLHVQEYQFFTISALVTFGGAYAVLAYVTQAVTSSAIQLDHAGAGR